MAINFDDQSTGISYQQFPKDPQAREQIQILDNKVEQLEQKTVSKQAIIDIESKVRQSELDKENFKIAVTKELTDVKTVVEGIDGGNVEKIAEIEAAVNLKANKDVVDSLLNQIEGSVKQINGNAPDETGNVIIDVNTEGLATIEEVTTKTDELAGLVFSKAEKADVEILAGQVANKASTQSVTALTSQLADKATKAELIPLANKAEKSEVVIVANQLTTLDAKINNQASDAPKGLYATLSALQTAFPTGTTGKYIVGETDGVKRSYIWANSTWTDLGVYQGIGIPSNSVDIDSTTFARRGKNKFDGKFINAVVLTDGTMRSDELSMSFIIPIVGGKKYFIHKDVGNRARLAFHKTLPILTSTPIPADYYVGENIANGSVQTAPVDAKYMIYTASNTKTAITLQVTEDKNYPFFIGYDVRLDLEPDSVPVNVLKDGDFLTAVTKSFNGVLYGNKPLLKIDYVAKTVVLPTGNRIIYNGKRTAINTTTISFSDNVNSLFMLLSFVPETAILKMQYIDPNTEMPKNEVLIGLIHPTKPEVYGFDITNCEINGKMFVHPQVTSEIDSRIAAITTPTGFTNRYFFLDDIQGVYSKPTNLASVSTGQPFVLQSSKHTDIYAIYDDLVARYPRYVTKKLLGNEATGKPIYQYNFTSPSITNESAFPYKKLKIAINSAIHGYEQGSAWCLALFFKDLCDNHSAKEQLKFMRWNVDFVVVPVCNPYGYDNNQRTNSNKIDLNRNFDGSWSLGVSDNDVNGYYGGASPASEIETQIVQAFIDANLDAEYFIDYHNIANGYPLVYLYDREASTIALNTFNVLTRKWKSDYPNSPQDETMFGYVKTGVDGASAKYAIKKGVKSFVFETPWMMPFGSAKYDKTTIETGVEAFGNVLITLFKSLR